VTGAPGSALHRQGEARGTSLLLGHFALLERLAASRRPSARERLEAKLGSELTRALLGSLGADGPTALHG
jgi:hypothetical protein